MLGKKKKYYTKNEVKIIISSVNLLLNSKRSKYLAFIQQKVMFSVNVKNVYAHSMSSIFNMIKEYDQRL